MLSEVDVFNQFPIHTIQTIFFHKLKWLQYKPWIRKYML